MSNSLMTPTEADRLAAAARRLGRAMRRASEAMDPVRYRSAQRAAIDAAGRSGGIDPATGDLTLSGLAIASRYLETRADLS